MADYVSLYYFCNYFFGTQFRQPSRNVPANQKHFIHNFYIFLIKFFVWLQTVCAFAVMTPRSPWQIYVNFSRRSQLKCNKGFFLEYILLTYSLEVFVFLPNSSKSVVNQNFCLFATILAPKYDPHINNSPSATVSSTNVRLLFLSLNRPLHALEPVPKQRASSPSFQCSSRNRVQLF